MTCFLLNEPLSSTFCLFLVYFCFFLCGFQYDIFLFLHFCLGSQVIGVTSLFSFFCGSQLLFVSIMFSPRRVFPVSPFFLFFAAVIRASPPVVLFWCFFCRTNFPEIRFLREKHGNIATISKLRNLNRGKISGTLIIRIFANIWGKVLEYLGGKNTRKKY